MFVSYDMENFGTYLKKIRSSLKLTQKKIWEEVGINQDTIRRIESGSVIPKYETLELLSSVYKIDLLSVLQSFRSEKDVINYYTRLDNAIIDNDMKALEIIKNEITKLKKEFPFDKLIMVNEFDMLISYADAAYLYWTDNFRDKLKAKEKLVEALNISIQDYSILRYKKFHYNFLELRILILIALLEADFQEYALSNQKLEFIIDKINELSEYDVVPLKFKLILYFNLSYNYFYLENDEKSYYFASEGIKEGLNKGELSALFPLYYRKGIAEYHLNDDNCVNSLRKCINLLEILEKYDLAREYRKITSEKYNIEV